MSEHAKADLEALEDFVQSRGRQLFEAYATKTWEDEFGRRVIEAIGSKALTDEQKSLALDRLQQAAAIREELRTLFKWPSLRIDQLRQSIQQQEHERQIGMLPGRRPQNL